MITLIITLLFVIHITVARPDGSPVCNVGSAAPASWAISLHTLRPNSDTGPISKRDFVVTIGNLTLDSTAVNTIPATELTLELSSTNGTQFRGVLIILNKDGVDLTSNFVSSNALLKAQEDCPRKGYSGITHTSRDFKSIADGIVSIPANLDVFLDVNVVIANNDTNSEYYYTRFQLIGESAPGPPVEAPVPAPFRIPCGLFGLSIFCFNGCGLFGRLFGLCN